MEKWKSKLKVQLFGHWQRRVFTFQLFHFFNFSTCAKRLVLVFGVKTRVFVEKGERLEGFHAVEEQHAIQMIDFMLDCPGQ